MPTDTLRMTIRQLPASLIKVQISLTIHHNRI